MRPEMGEAELPKVDLSSASAGAWELASLLGLFPGEDLKMEEIRIVGEREVPEPFQSLLVHESHMTVTLEAFHRAEVQLVVQDRKWVGDVYCRKLYLTAGIGGKPVLAGLIKFHMSRCAGAIREQVVGESTPLGKILMEHCALRRIEPHAFVKVPLNGHLREFFRAPERFQSTYGRVATITCGNTPAVELLEVVSPEDPPARTPTG